MQEHGLTYDGPFGALNKWEAAVIQEVVIEWYSDQNNKTLAVKFPLYPGLIRTLWLLTDRRIPAGWWLYAVHLACGLFALIQTYRYWQEFYGVGNAVILFSLAPATLDSQLWVFNYDDALFMGLVWITLRHYRQGSNWAYFYASLLTISRPMGIVLAGLLGIDQLLLALRQRQITLGLALSTYPLYVWLIAMTYISHRLSSPLAPYLEQHNWGRSVWRLPWDRLAHFVRQAAADYPVLAAYNVYLFILVGAASLLALYLMMQRRLPWYSVLYALIAVWLPYATAADSIGRYSLATDLIAVPFLITTAAWRTQHRRTLLILLTLGWALNIARVYITATVYNSWWQL
jgi:hypothetical protein